MNEEDLSKILQRLALLEEKTRGFRTLTPEEEDEIRRKKKNNGDGGDVFLSGGKANKTRNPDARDGRIYLKETGGVPKERVVVFNFDTSSFEPADDPDTQSEG
jgi:hypothetical protein